MGNGFGVDPADLIVAAEHMHTAAEHAFLAGDRASQGRSARGLFGPSAAAGDLATKWNSAVKARVKETTDVGFAMIELARKLRESAESYLRTDEKNVDELHAARKGD